MQPSKIDISLEGPDPHRELHPEAHGERRGPPRDPVAARGPADHRGRRLGATCQATQPTEGERRTYGQRYDQDRHPG
eukprot:6545809-Pyramimonas_sp.AAC.1